MPQVCVSCQVERAETAHSGVGVAHDVGRRTVHGPALLQPVSRLVQKDKTKHYLRVLWRDVKMNSETRMTGRIIAAARALAGISREDFAVAAGISVDAMTLMEANGSAWLRSENDAEAISRAFEKFGVVVIDESDGMGAGVRLKFTRQDVNQIARLEGEGGIVRSDDAP